MATKHTNKAVTAVARELAGSVWAALQTVAGKEVQVRSQQGEGARQEDPRLRYAAGHVPTRGPRQRLLQTDLCVCGTQPADISLSHRRRSLFPQENAGPRALTRGPHKPA